MNVKILELLEQLRAHHQPTYDHSIRVANLAQLLVMKLNLSESEQRRIYWGGLLHDIGKLFVDIELLDKTEKLTLSEWTEMKNHSIYGYNLIHKYGLPKDLGYIVLFHHERSDGSGYPFGIKKDKIPIDTQIVAVADSFDAMTMERIYNQPITQQQAIIELKEEAEILYSSGIIQALEDVLQTTEVYCLVT